MRVIALTILRFLLWRIASAALMLSLISGQSALMLPPDARDQLLVCLPQAASCSPLTSDLPAAINTSATAPAPADDRNEDIQLPGAPTIIPDSSWASAASQELAPG